jgi:CHAD domain-containing protein
MLGPFLSNTLRRRWESYRAQLRACQDDFSEETVHELRVATRRLIAQFVMLECVTPGKTAAKARRVLKRRLKSLGELRDTHVQRMFVERKLARFPELILVREFLQRQERRVERAAAAKVKGFKARKLEKCISALERHLASRPVQPRRPERLATIVAQATTKAFEEVVERRRAIDPANAASVHRTRIAFKKFRYMVESLSPEFTGLGKRELRALARYQRRMGILQDLEVMQHCITGFVQQHRRMDPLLTPFTRHLQTMRARALRSFLKSADDLFQFWPPGRGRMDAHRPAAREAA